jgi:hypothetical protein
MIDTTDDGLPSRWFDVLGCLGSAVAHTLLGLTLVGVLVGLGVLAGRVGGWTAGGGWSP